LAAGRAYPASIVTYGQALNITCQSYAGAMNFGFTGCHSSQPGMQHLAVYAAAALKDLENAIPPRPKRAPRAAARAPQARHPERKWRRRRGDAASLASTHTPSRGARLRLRLFCGA